MSRKKFVQFPVNFNWRDLAGCSSLCFGLLVATISLNETKGKNHEKKETVISIAEKNLKKITNLQIIQKQQEKLVIVSPSTPEEPSNPPSEQVQKDDKRETIPIEGMVKKVFNKKFSVN